MAIKMVRAPSDTPNITNIDDIIAMRYAYGNQNGYVKGKGSEISHIINGLEFTLRSGRAVLDGVENDIDANGVTLTIDNVATLRYFIVYLKVNLGLNTVTIETINDTMGYPTLQKGDDLTVVSNGIANLELYRFTTQGAVISNVKKVVKEIQYLNDIDTKINNISNVLDVTKQNVDNIGKGQYFATKTFSTLSEIKSLCGDNIKKEFYVSLSLDITLDNNIVLPKYSKGYFYTIGQDAVLSIVDVNGFTYSAYYNSTTEEFYGKKSNMADMIKSTNITNSIETNGLPENSIISMTMNEAKIVANGATYSLATKVSFSFFVPTMTNTANFKVELGNYFIASGVFQSYPTWFRLYLNVEKRDGKVNYTFKSQNLNTHIDANSVSFTVGPIHSIQLYS